MRPEPLAPAPPHMGLHFQTPHAEGMAERQRRVPARLRAAACPLAEDRALSSPCLALAVVQCPPPDGVHQSEPPSCWPACFRHLWVLLSLLDHSRKLSPRATRWAQVENKSRLP